MTEPEAGALRDAADYETLRKQRNWPTPGWMRHTADALDMLMVAKYGDVLRWVADQCDAALAKPEPAGLTPLQRELATPPTCSRCQRYITNLGDLYRCASCHAPFHYGCILEHFGWSASGRDHEPAPEAKGSGA